eukprot:TRINITY_DN27224_c0_g2_i1.p1 TRINITY_DN27224_c0_g2~~TRINITY_DN27224_c0_g2_i1.p1  ORF type:complete len:3147 (+),score=582.09 TRINITY_DN27224_c0_g2_i1:27-9467(+)
MGFVVLAAGTGVLGCFIRMETLLRFLSLPTALRRLRCRPERGMHLLLFVICSLLPACSGYDVQQQSLITQTVSQTALQASFFNDVADPQAWTNNNQNARADTVVQVQFAENIQESLGYITIQPAVSGIGTSSASATTLTVPSTDVIVSGQSIFVNDATSANGRQYIFQEETTYTLSYDAGIISNLANTDTNAAFSVQFTTGDFTSPSVVSYSPVDNAPAVATSDSIVITFSEAVQANTAGTTVVSIEESWYRTTPNQWNPNCNDAAITISGAVVTISLTAPNLVLLPCQQYAMSYTHKCFYDTSPNANWAQGLDVLANYDFWTSCITGYSPAIGTFANLISTDITLTFAEDVLPGTGNIVVTPLGETSQNYAVTDTSRVQIVNNQVTILGDVAPSYLCLGLSMQNCKGKPVDVSIAYGVLYRDSTTAGAPAPPGGVPQQLEMQLTGSDYRFTFKPADLTPPTVTVVSMYGISEDVIRVTIRLDESGTTYCRAYDSGSWYPTSQGGSDVPTLTDCTACLNEIKTDANTADDPLYNFVGSSTYDSTKGFAEHEVDITGLTDKTFYWVYCYSHDIEIPTFNVVTSAQMLATERSVRTLDTTPPSFGSFSCAPTALTEDSITVTLTMNEAGRAYCKVVNRGFLQPTPNAVIAEGFYLDVTTTSAFTIAVNQITTGLGATGMEALHRKWDYDVYCWAQDAEGYPYYGPNGMVQTEACPNNYVTTLDLTRPNMRFVMAESISASQIIITLQVDEGAKVWCAAWDTDPGLTSLNYEAQIKGMANDCQDNKGRQCGSFWIYDLDDLEDTTTDGMDTQADYDSSVNWKYNQDVDIIVSGLTEEKDYPFIYCYAEDDESDGNGGSPNKMLFDDTGQSGPNNVHTIKTGIGTVQTLDESPPTFKKLSMMDPTDFNDRIIVTFALNEAGTAYCRVTRSDSGETTLRINRILTANYYAAANVNQVMSITVEKLESTDTQVLYEASQYDVYCWALDAAVNTQGQPRPNYMTQDYVDTAVGTTSNHAQNSPSGGKTTSVWVKDMTPPTIIYVSSEALTEDTIQITLQLNEPGTVWCQPVMPSADATYVDEADLTAGNYRAWIKGRSGAATFVESVHYAFTNIDVEVDKLEREDGAAAVSLSMETPYRIFCFAQDDWDIEAPNAGSLSINFDNSNVGAANEILFGSAQTFSTAVGEVVTLDLTPPVITITAIASTETSITVSLRLDETGTAWCQAVRYGFNVPTILEILDTNFYTGYTYSSGSPSATVDVLITGYDRPVNSDPAYTTPLVLGTDYDVYCYADDDLCVGCKVTNGVSSTDVTATKQFIRTLDLTPPSMRFIAAESIAHDQIIITLQVDEGAKVWCAAWHTDPGLSSSDYISRIKAESATCQDNLGNQCGSFWVYDLDDIEDTSPHLADGVNSQADYDGVNWKYNQDVDIIVNSLQEETDYPYIYCYAEDDEQTPNTMNFDNSGNPGPQNVHTMKTEIGTIQTLDESPPIFEKLAILDPTAENDRIVVTFKLNEAGTAYCRVTRSDSGETTLRINQILSANYPAIVSGQGIEASITVDKLESTDTLNLYEASQYDVYCWAKDSAVDTHLQPRPNYMTQTYLETDVGTSFMTAPNGGRTRYVWVKDTTPPEMIYVSSEAITDSKLQVTLQLNEPGTVWCHPVMPSTHGTMIDVDDVDSTTYMSYIKGRHASFMEYVPTPYTNVDVEVDYLDDDGGTSSTLLTSETPYNIYCFAQDDWKIESQNSVDQSPNWQLVNTATVNMSVGNTGNEVPFEDTESILTSIGQVITLDLTPPTITIVGWSTGETPTKEPWIEISLSLDETGTAWCQAVRKGFDEPTILEILDTNYKSTYTYSPGGTTTVLLTGYDRPLNSNPSYETPLVLGTDYDVYCYADDDLCVGCKVTNGVSFAHVQSTKTEVRTKDLTKPNMKFVAAESIAKDKILVTLQVDEGSKVWCAAWSTDPNLASLTAANTIKAQAANCQDGRGNQCGVFWVYDLDDIEDTSPHVADGVSTIDEYNDVNNWKFNQDVDIIVSGLAEETDYPYIYCYAEDDEASPNGMIFDNTANFGANNMHTMQQEIGTVQTLDESPPIFTRLAMADPTALNDRIVVTFQLNEAGTAYCRTKRSDSAETTLRINQILTADFSAEITNPTDTASITITKLENRDTQSLYEASKYDVYCWAKDSAVDTQGLVRPNYMIQDYVEAAIGSDTTSPLGGMTANVWVTDSTPPTIIVVSREALGESLIQVTLQLDEPGTIWCQIAEQAAFGTTGTYCREQDVSNSPGDPCHFETWTKGETRGLGSTTFMAEVHVPYQDYDIDLTAIENRATAAGDALTKEYYYNIYCFAEDDWKIEADASASPSPLYNGAVNPSGPNKIVWAAATSVKDTIGQVQTLDQTSPLFTSISYTRFSEDTLLMQMTLDETGTIWCMPVRTGFAEPSINEILQNNEFNANCGTSQCVVTMTGLDAKTLYDVWCYAEDDNVYPQIPNGMKFTTGDMQTMSTLDTTPPILTIVSAESPIKTDIRVKVKMEEPGTVWCNSYKTSTAYGTVDFNSVMGAGFYAYVGFPSLSPNSPINTNVEVVVTNLEEQTQYDTYCTAQDASTLMSVNRLLDSTTQATVSAIGQIITLDQSPPTFTQLGASGTDENTIQVTFTCNEACRAYCRVTRSDSGETSLSINRILKANYYADQNGGATAATIDIKRLEDDSSVALLERGTLYDTYCWIRDEALQYSCHAQAPSASCSTFPRHNYQGQTYVDTAFGGTPPSSTSSPSGGKMLHVRTPDTTPPTIVFVEAESTEETSITITLQLDEPGTAYCKAYTSTQTVDSALYTDLTTGTVYKNTVTNWHNTYLNFEVKVSGLSMETKYYVYCAAEDDEFAEGATSISPAPVSNNEATAILTESSGRFTLDLTPPSITVVSIVSNSETTATVTLQLDEPGTAWCRAVRDLFDPPTINQIIAASFSSTVTTPNTDFTVQVQNLERDTEYDVYCHARDRGTEVETGVTPEAGNPGNDVTFAHVQTTKRDIHTMGDSTSPSLVSVSPVHLETGVDMKPTFTMVFNEDLQAGTGLVTFTPNNGVGGTPGTAVTVDVTEANTGSCNPAKVSITLTTFQIDWSQCALSTSLAASTQWSVSFAAGVLKDEASNDVAAFGTGSSYYFTTTA